MTLDKNVKHPILRSFLIFVDIYFIGSRHKKADANPRITVQTISRLVDENFRILPAILCQVY